jgi:hypothetical protein
MPAPRKGKTAPKVSVVTPMYNAAAYIAAAIGSIRAQGFGDFEHIVVDDGSTDGSADIVARLAREDQRLRLVRLPRNVGYSGASNAGFAEARGEYIAIMDADDVSHPDRLARQAAYLDAHPHVGLVATQYWRLSPGGRVMRRTFNRLGDAALRFHLLFGVPVCNPSTMFRRAAVAKWTRVYDPAYKASPEYDFLLRLADEWDLHVLPEYLFYYRINPTGLSKAKKDLLVEEVTAQALRRALPLMPELAAHAEDIGRFIAIQWSPRAVDAAGVKAYVRGLDALRRAFIKRLSAADRHEVNLFCAELEAKTILGRHKAYRKPGLLVAWVTAPGNQLRNLPAALMRLAREVLAGACDRPRRRRARTAGRTTPPAASR